MTIERCIIDLLFAEDCVIIPGLGGFVSQYQPARIISETNTFIPPSKEIAFKIGLEGDPDRLIQLISEWMELTHEMADQKLSEWVRNLKRKAERGDRIFVEGIGSFVLQSDGELRFNADQGVNFLMDSYGLFPFHLREVEVEHDRMFRRIPVTRREEPAKREMLPGTELPKVKKGAQRAAIAIAIPILLVLLLVPFNSRVSQILTRHPASIAPLPSLYQLNMPDQQMTDSSGREITFPLEDTTKTPQNSEPVVVKENPPATVVDESALLRYPIIAGSFKSERYAQRLERTLTSRGYQAKVLPFSGGWIRVSIESFATLPEAQAAISQLIAAEPNLSMWIMK